MRTKTRLAKKIRIRLKEFRKSMGLSIKQLSEETELSPCFFSKIENGMGIPSITALINISNSINNKHNCEFNKGG
jgi:transcriptional regulator with XRE-family HTH domain